MFPFEKLTKQSYPIHFLQIQDDTEKRLWHQGPSHICDQYLYNAHKYIDRVPKFSDTISRVLDHCLTCIQDKMSKTPPGHGITRGMVSDNNVHLIISVGDLIWQKELCGNG